MRVETPFAANFIFFEHVNRVINVGKMEEFTLAATSIIFESGENIAQIEFDSVEEAKKAFEMCLKATRGYYQWDKPSK